MLGGLGSRHFTVEAFPGDERLADTRELEFEGRETRFHVVEAALDVSQTAAEFVAETADALVHVLFDSAHGLEQDLIVGADEAAGLGFDNLIVGADEVADLVEVFLGHMPPVRSGQVPAPELSVPRRIVPRTGLLFHYDLPDARQRENAVPSRRPSSTRITLSC